MKAFFLLIRPINLLIISATMYCLRLFLIVYEQYFETEVLKAGSEKWDFFLLVFSTVLIAAAGNAINDYFDERADRVNRPQKLIIGKRLKRRWAIVSHWILNGIAFGIALLLSWRNDTFWYVFIHLISINSLWLYSLFLKKKALTGNLLIAGLTALVPILCGVHFYVQNSLVWQRAESGNSFEFWLNTLVVDGYFIFLLAFFAFTNNFAREIIKDIEDVKGDKLINAKTLPIKFGQKISKIWVGGFLILPLLVFGSIFFWFHTKTHYSILEQMKVFLPVMLSFACNLLAITLLYKAQKRPQLVRADRWVKIAMVLGISTPIYWFFIYL
jgi:4-hydroxybenzoate polyprenyltransferase